MISIRHNGHKEIKYKKTIFPCGEQKITIDYDIKKHNPMLYDTHIHIFWGYENVNELFDVIAIHDYFRSDFKYNIHVEKILLRMPYVPFSRQDRSFKNECFTLKTFCRLINSCNFDEVTIFDPHSDVTPALLNNVFVEGNSVNEAKMLLDGDYYLLAPDAGATKRVNSIAKDALDNNLQCRGVIQATKHRDLKTGNITKTEVYNIPKDNYPIIIVDDICEGGRTFIEIAKILKNQNPDRKIILYVTHGFFSAGLDVFDNYIDEIYTYNGKVENVK